MSWFGNSLVNLKDQITTLTKEIVAEADEDENQPKFVPYEKFDRLLKICEEKEDQLSQLQLEVEELRNSAKATPVCELKSTQTADDDENDNGDGTNASAVRSESTTLETENSQEYDNAKGNTENAAIADVEAAAAAQSLHGGDIECNWEKQTQNVLQKIENLTGKNRLNLLQTILKEVKCQYDAEKAKHKMSASVISFPSSKTSHGTDETMSNDSERSDDSFLNDFEILKLRRGASSKSLEEYAICHATSTAAANSSNMEASNATKVDSAGGKIGESGVDENKTNERDELDRVLETNSHCWEEVFDKMKSLSCDEQAASFWDELCNVVSKNNEALKNYTRSLYRENLSWDEYYRSLGQDKETLKKHADELTERERRLVENDRSRTSTLVERVGELDSCRKKLEDFNESLNEVGREVYDELNALREENARLTNELEAKNDDGDVNDDDDEEAKSRLNTLEEAIRERDELLSRAVEMQNELESRQAVAESALRERDELARQLEETEEATKALNDELQTTKLELAGIEESRRRDDSSAEEERTAHKQTMLELVKRDEAVAEMEERCRAIAESALRERDELTRQLEETKQTTKALNEELRTTKLKLAGIEESRQRDDSSAVLELQKRDSAVAAAEERNRALRREIDELLSRVDEMRNELESRRAAAESATRERDELTRQLETTKEATSSLNEELRSTKLELAKMEEHDGSSVEAERAAHERTRRELVSQEAAVAAMEERNRAFRQEIDSVASKFAREIDTLRGQVMALDERKNQLENDIEAILRCGDGTSGKAKLEEIVASLQRYFVTSSQERRSNDDVWRRLSTFVVDELPTETRNDNERLLAKMATDEEAFERVRRECEEAKASLAEKCGQIAALDARVANFQQTLETTAAEREQLITSLKEKHNESVAYHAELQKVHGLLMSEAEQKRDYEQQLHELKQRLSNNGNVSAELERLRQHLITTEDAHTQELVSCETQIKELKAKVAEYEERIKSLTATQTSVNVRTNQITESLQKEIKSLIDERDKLSSNLKTCQVELQKSVNDAQNLRSALDFFRRNKDSEIFQATEKLRTDIELLKNENRVLDETVGELRGNLSAMKQAFEELDDLRGELKNKEDVITWHKSQATKMQTELEEAKKKITELQTDAENKYELNLLKNIVLRYILGTTDVMKAQALQILAEVLDFSKDERRQIGLSVAGEKPDGESQRTKNSLIDEFIRFMEKESSPENPSRSRKVSSQNALLSSNPSLPDVMLPTLSQFPANRNSRYILKDVLQ